MNEITVNVSGAVGFSLGIVAFLTFLFVLLFVRLGKMAWLLTKIHYLLSAQAKQTEDKGTWVCPRCGIGGNPTSASKCIHCGH